MISEEPFFNLPGLSELRLRAAYGEAGDAPPPFEADRVYGASTAVMDDGSLASALTIPASRALCRRGNAPPSLTSILRIPIAEVRAIIRPSRGRGPLVCP